jgi:hypothetical protein
MDHFCPSGSGSGLQIRIRIPNTDPDPGFHKIQLLNFLNNFLGGVQSNHLISSPFSHKIIFYFESRWGYQLLNSNCIATEFFPRYQNNFSFRTTGPLFGQYCMCLQLSDPLLKSHLSWSFIYYFNTRILPKCDVKDSLWKRLVEIFRNKPGKRRILYLG